MLSCPIKSPQRNAVHATEDVTGERGVTNDEAEGAVTPAFDLPFAIGKNRHYLTHIPIDRLHLLILNFELHAEGAEFDELTIHTTLRDMLSPIICSLGESFGTVLDMVLQQPAAPPLVARDESHLPVRALHSLERVATPAFRDCSVIYTDLSWADTRGDAANKYYKTPRRNWKERKSK